MFEKASECSKQCRYVGKVVEMSENRASELRKQKTSECMKAHKKKLETVVKQCRDVSKNHRDVCKNVFDIIQAKP